MTCTATQRHPPRVPLREEGRFGRSSRNAGRDAVDAAVPGAFMRSTIGTGRGRRSRVVLTPQGWRQVSHHDVRGDGDNKARSPGRARRKPLKPSAQGRPASSGEPVVTNSCACFHRTRGCGCIGHPAFPAPSLLLRDTQDTRLGQSLSRECGRAPSWLFEIVIRERHALLTLRWRALLGEGAHFGAVEASSATAVSGYAPARRSEL